jgi:hypothetical protein
LLAVFLIVNLFSAYAVEDIFSLFPEVKSWKRLFVDEVYTPDNLWDHINGAAEGYK